MTSMPPIQRLRISHSSRETWDSCEQKFAFRKMYRRGNPGWDDSVPAGAGRAIHAGFQEWLVSGDINRAAYQLMLAYPVDLNVNPGHERSVEACFATLEAMIAHADLGDYEVAYIDLPNRGRVPAIEIPFEFELLNFSLSDDIHIPVFYTGYVDAFLFSRSRLDYAQVDIKTHRNDMLDLTPKFAYDEQATPYTLVLNHATGKHIDSISTKYISCYVDVTKPKIALYEFERTHLDIQEWLMRLAADVMVMKARWNMGWFKRKPQSCLNFKKVCPEFDVCALKNDPEAAQRYLLMGIDFEEAYDPNDRKPWDPWFSLKLDLGL